MLGRYTQYLCATRKSQQMSDISCVSFFFFGKKNEALCFVFIFVVAVMGYIGGLVDTTDVAVLTGCSCCCGRVCGM